MLEPNRMCDLECVKDDKKVMEFVGPVKIVIVDPPPKLYRRRICAAAFIVIAHMMIGVVTLTLFYYSLTYKMKLGANIHIFLCTAGYQLCLPSGILMINNFNGAAAPMKIEDRRFQHMFLQLFGLGIAICGSVAVFFFDGVSLSEFTVHSLAGLAAGGLGVVTLLFGPLVHCTKNRVHGASKMHHIFFGVLTMTSATVCFVLGLLKPQFMSWIPVPEMFTFTVIFCVISTFIVIVSPIYKFVKYCGII